MKNINRLISLLLFLFLISCQRKNIASKTNIIEVSEGEKSFSMTLPKKWKYASQNGIDSFVGDIVKRRKKILHFDYGYYSNSLENPVFQHKREIDERFLKKLELLNTVNGVKAKFVYHKYLFKSDIGYHIDSLWKDNEMDIVKFTIYGENLSKNKQEKFKQAFNTITFKKI